MTKNFVISNNQFTLKVFLLLSLALLVLLLPRHVHAASGPVGLNQLRVEAGPGPRQITLIWQRYHPDVTGYTLVYGETSGKYKYGAADIGNVATFTVSNLKPGVRYYFLLIPSRNGVPVPATSPEISEVALASASTVVGTSGPYGQRSLVAIPGPGTRKITLAWTQLLTSTDTFNIIYGLAPGKYLWGASGLVAAGQGKRVSFTIGNLQSGVRYYFALIPSTGGTGAYISAEVSQVAP